MSDLGILIPIAGIVMGCSIPIMAIRAKTQLKLAQLRAGESARETAERAAQYASGVKALEDRVRVLERIVTDNGYDVATQIEALRDQHRVEGDTSGSGPGSGSGRPLDIGLKESV